ncbi:MAG TPA: FAD-binding oxidoreductase, partial [Thermomicrobiales bacterium]|nr:FAD-binding oxidoreductase [Thermomicrobiales bacterium]
RHHPVIIDAVHHSWLRPEGQSSTLIGAERGVADTDLDAFDETLDARVIPIARDALAARLPVFADATMRGGWSGTFMGSADGHPIIDQVPSVPGLWVMAGDNGSSFKTAPATGVCLAEWIVDGAPKLMDLTPFRSSRFAEDAAWIDPTAYGDGRRYTVSR